MFASTLILAAGAMNPQVQACATAVRADNPEATELCQPPKIDLFSDTPEDVSAECRAAMKAGQATRKVPSKIRWTVLRKFESAMASCAAGSGNDEVPTRDVVKLSD